MSARLIQALRRPGCYPHACGAIEVLETHLSWVLLAGRYAYKIKKPVALGFVDFTTLARRRAFCHEELRLNRRLAPRLYLGVIAIRGTADRPRLASRGRGRGRVLEYAVRMRRFPQAALATHLLRERKLDAAQFEALARDIAAFHGRCPGAGPAEPRGDPDRVLQAVRQNFSQLAALPGLAARELEPLRRWSEQRFAALRPVMLRRRREGRVRECHGDLHLGNLALIGGRLVAFDGIDFNPDLRWIDTASEVAFTVMDLRHRGAPALAHRFLDAWLEASGDYGALEVLDFFQVYRALVRAKVAGLRAAQCAPGSPEDAGARAELRGYLALARALTRGRPPLLVITHGVSGSGKSTLAGTLVESLGLVRLRSDVERKRLFGLPAAARTASGVGAGLYAPAVTRRTYAALEGRAAAVLRAGYGVVVDATFLRRERRDRFARLARIAGCPFRIVALHAPKAVLRRRITARARAAHDASEATPAVLASQLAGNDALGGDERACTIFVDARTSGGTLKASRALARARARRAGPLTQVNAGAQGGATVFA